MKKGCTVYYDNTEMTYYHRLFFTDCRVVWTVSKGSINYPGSMYESKTDYIYDPHNEDWKNLFVIDGIIKEIKAVYVKQDYVPALTVLDGNVKAYNSLTDVDYEICDVSTCQVSEEKDGMLFRNYEVYFEEYSIRPAKKEDANYF